MTDCRAVLVTGAGSGIGRAIALHLAGQGFTVFAVGRTAATLADLTGEGGERIIPVTMDVTDEGSVAGAMTQIASHLDGGSLYAVVNNAGISVTGPIERVPDADWRAQFDTNVFGMMNVTRAVLPQMRAAGEGRVVNISSVTGRLAPPFMGVYAASKHAVEGLSDALRREVKQFGIKVSVIRPGFVNTGFGDQEQAGLEPYMQEGEPYRDSLIKFSRWHHDKGHKAAPPPHCVAVEVERALTDKSPRTRYSAPRKALWLIAARNFLPAPLVDAVTARITGIS
ncbi:SDR family oxidoreductase [Aquisalinus flavus]|uniref:Short-chain dehydrogenase n=1 Tax=Aquisalinus flavus TaxID=1526572 RepID=A0A8J2Y6I7_9PROT|nr:SDR family oxidoreductase [Aquisalinus flavus]MBD0427771.1 SDR family oxidoreductase [Aquisalinus flavus]UNE47545.1 SDR family oxidoreductase [Aquisalinus flavus]GGD03713.1 short-chain dehydrogenase [Aquisalinus flavus]